jgi:hypothetical protein
MAPKPTKPVPAGPRKIRGYATSRKVENKTLKPGSMATQSKIVTDKPTKKPSTKYSPAPMSDAAKAKARIAAAKKQPSLTSKAGKVAGKVAGVAVSKVKADIKAAKMFTDFAARAATFPGEMVLKGAKAGAKALAKPPRTRQMYRQVGKGGTTIKQLMNNKNIKKK